MKLETGKLGTALFSDDMVYRYLLTRNCGNENPSWWVTFLMLNPSTADHEKNDPTIKRCLGFAETFCEGWQGARDQLGVRIVNLFAFRSPKPKVCFAYPKPVGGLENDRAIMDACLTAALVITAWGTQDKAASRAREVRGMLVDAGVPMHRLGSPTKNGSPPHPLYLEGETMLEAWA